MKRLAAIIRIWFWRRRMDQTDELDAEIRRRQARVDHRHAYAFAKFCEAKADLRHARRSAMSRDDLEVV